VLAKAILPHTRRGGGGRRTAEWHPRLHHLSGIVSIASAPREPVLNAAIVTPLDEFGWP